jgi:hypothetical protein
MRAAGRAPEAVEGFSTLLEDVTSALGASHSLVAQTEISLARALADTGRTALALDHAITAERQLSALYGAEHSRTVAARELIQSLEARR